MYTTPNRSQAVIAGRVLSGLIVLFLLIASATPKLTGHLSATESFATLGYPEGVHLPIGVTEAVLAILYAIPATSVLGAIGITGLLGGAVASQFRIGDPWFLFAVGVGILMWFGLYLREPRLRMLLPLRRLAKSSDTARPAEPQSLASARTETGLD